MTEKAPGDPEIVMLAAVTRAAAQDQLFALLRVVQDCASIAKIWEALRIDPETVDTTALTHWLSHEAPRNETPLQSVAWEIESLMSCIKDNIAEYDRAHDLQKEMNRIRLRLMRDVDFPGGERWDALIAACKETAQKSRR